MLENIKKFLLDEKFAKGTTEFGYTVLLDGCNTILTGENPTQSVLALFKVHFADHFESEEVLRSRVGQGVLPC